MLENGSYRERDVSASVGKDNWSVEEVKAASQQAFLAGWVHGVRRDGETVLEFPSPVHEWYVVPLSPDGRKCCRVG